MDEHEDGEKRERVLLRPWLENLIEGGSIPGLEWLDDSKTMFKVPWKHRSKKTWSLRHSSIFLEWAKNTGRWSEDDPEPNYAQLKTRLRCAFNKAPDIEEMKELHRTKAEEPYKVYKFIPRKESKLYPFGRRPLRKTTVPITVRRRRYLISRISSACSGPSGNRLGISNGTTTFKIKQEKENTAANESCKESVADENFSETADRQGWMHSSWVPDYNQRMDLETGTAWPGQYERKAKDETISRILPLIVEEENFNSSVCFDLQLPALRDRAAEAKIPCSILPEISKDHIDPSKRAASESVTVAGDRCKQSYTEGFLTDEAWRLSGIKQNCAGSVSMLPATWAHKQTEKKSSMTNHSAESLVQAKKIPSSVQIPEEVTAQKQSSHHLAPAARLFPLKNRYNLSQNAFSRDKSPDVAPPARLERRQNLAVRPNGIAQPRVAIATPYDGKPSSELEQLSVTEHTPTGSCLDLVKNSPDACQAVLRSPELDVIDLSFKVSASERKEPASKVLDLTKKMIVTPFERNCHTSESALKGSRADNGKEIDESLLSSDPVALSSVVDEILKFKADYKRKKQLIVTKTMLLVEKERELKAREKQLTAREEALFWKENYLHKVMSGVDVSNVAPFIRSAEPLLSVSLIGSPEARDISLKNLSLPSFPMFPPKSSPVVIPGTIPGRHQPSVAAAVTLTRPEPSNLMPAFQFSPVSGKTNLLSTSNISQTLPPVHIKATLPGDSSIGVKASVLPSAEQSGSHKNAELGFEPETDVALGDADPVRRSYFVTAKKSELDVTQLMPSGPEAPSQSLMRARKRGRPKGSKNKVKMPKVADDPAVALRQMPPLLVIQSQSMKDAFIPDQIRQNSFPFHVMRDGSVPGIAIDSYKPREALSTSTLHLEKDHHPGIASTSCSFYSTSRILPPVTTNSDPYSIQTAASGRPYGIPTPEASISIPSASVPYTLLDHLSSKDTMPDAVRQLLMSASRPVSTILPPLSPSKSPDEILHETVPDAIDLCSEKLPSGDSRVASSIR